MANITLETGIKISNFKVNLTLDGAYDGITYQFEDKKPYQVVIQLQQVFLLS